MPTLPSALGEFNFYSKYLWQHGDFAQLQTWLQGLSTSLPNSLMGCQNTILFGNQVTLVSGMQVSVSAGVSMNTANRMCVLSSPTTGTFATPASHDAWSLIVLRPTLTDSNFITNPTNPATTVPLYEMLTCSVVMIDGTPSASPAYPSTQAGDIVLMGFKIPSGTTTLTAAMFDFSQQSQVNQFPASYPFVSVKQFGAAGDGVTDDTVAIQNAINSTLTTGFGQGGVFFPEGLYIVSNLTVPAATTLRGVGRHQSILRGKSGSTGYMVTDTGDAAKIILQDLCLDANGNSYTTLLRLGYGSTQWGTEGILNNIFVRDNTSGIGIDLNANVGICCNVSIWNCSTNLNVIGNANMFVNTVISGFSSYGIIAGDSFFYGTELEAPANSAVPFKMIGQVHTFGTIVSWSTTIDHIFEMPTADSENNTIFGLTIYNNGTLSSGIVLNGSLYFGQGSPYPFSAASFAWHKKIRQTTIITDAIASAASYAINLDYTVPDCNVIIHTDVASPITFNFNSTLPNYFDRKIRITNNNPTYPVYMYGLSGNLYLLTRSVNTLINYDQTIGLPIRPTCSAEIDFSGEISTSASNEIRVISYENPEFDTSSLGATPTLLQAGQGKWWQGEVIHNKASTAGGAGKLLAVCTTTGYVIDEAWTTGHTYVKGEYVSASGKVYIAASSGTAGATTPNWNSGTNSDGGVNWTYVAAYSAAVFKQVAIS